MYIISWRINSKKIIKENKLQFPTHTSFDRDNSKVTKKLCRGRKNWFLLISLFNINENESLIYKPSSYIW